MSKNSLDFKIYIYDVFNFLGRIVLKKIYHELLTNKNPQQNENTQYFA